MGWDRVTWRMNVANMLFEMSNIGFQKAIWQAKIPGLMHSFSELVCNIGDYAIPDGLSTFVEKKISSSEEAVTLKTISEKVDSILQKHPDITDWEAEKIISNEDWLEIVSKAEKLFNRNFKSDFLSNQDNQTLIEEWP